MQRLGIIGGGQLGAMTIAAAIKFGVSISVMDNDPGSPSAKYTSGYVCGDPLNYADVVAFGRDKDIVIIEKEAINADALRLLSSEGIRVYPDPELLSMIQDKYRQKHFLQSHGIPVVPGVYVSDAADLRSKVETYPSCLKLCRNGYDGKGVQTLHSPADLAGAFDAPCVLESFVNIDKEIAVIVARDSSGHIIHYDPVQMTYDPALHILEFQCCPGDITEGQRDEAVRLATEIARITDLTGIMAVEMFVDTNGKILVNELAPRAHNSGHHTIEAAATSQYEQHIRAVLGLPLGDTKLTSKSVMINIISSGTDSLQASELMQQLLSMGGVYVHWYGKEQNKPGRKIGHINVVGDDMQILLQKAKEIKSILYNYETAVS